MKTIIRATLMLATFGGIGWAIGNFGDLQSVRRTVGSAIESLDQATAPDRDHDKIAVGQGPTMPKTLDSPQSYRPLQLRQEPPKATQQDFSGPPLVQSDGDPIEKLRGLGASEVAVQPWGGSGDLYRCSCEMPSQKCRGAIYHFDAIAQNPSDAAQAVLIEVGNWQSSVAPR